MLNRCESWVVVTVEINYHNAEISAPEHRKFQHRSKEIVDKYIRVGSEFEVNIPDSMRKVVLREVDEGKVIELS